MSFSRKKIKNIYFKYSYQKRHVEMNIEYGRPAKGHDCSVIRKHFFHWKYVWHFFSYSFQTRSKKSTPIFWRLIRDFEYWLTKLCRNRNCFCLLPMVSTSIRQKVNLFYKIYLSETQSCFVSQDFLMAAMKVRTTSIPIFGRKQFNFFFFCLKRNFFKNYIP